MCYAQTATTTSCSWRSLIPSPRGTGRLGGAGEERGEVGSGLGATGASRASNTNWSTPASGARGQGVGEPPVNVAALFGASGFQEKTTG